MPGPLPAGGPNFRRLWFAKPTIDAGGQAAASPPGPGILSYLSGDNLGLAFILKRRYITVVRFHD